MASDTGAARVLDPSELRRQKILARSEERLAALTGMRRPEVQDASAAEPVLEQAPDQRAPPASSRPMGAPGAIPEPSAATPGPRAEPQEPSGTATAHRWAEYASPAAPGPGPRAPTPELATCLRAALRLTALPRLALAVWWAWAGVCGAGAPGPWYALAATVGALMVATTLALQSSFPSLVHKLEGQTPTTPQVLQALLLMVPNGPALLSGWQQLALHGTAIADVGAAYAATITLAGPGCSHPW
ncbi:hypothetical protein ACKKBF_B02595 [Auxenochlorella protothecoides x Auxenochlorella symbiontica]